jgi:hypothetical protein
LPDKWETNRLLLFNERDDYMKRAKPTHTAEMDIPNIKREFILTQSADETLQDAVRLFSRATGTQLSNSHFLRVLIKGLAHAMPELEREASQIGKLKRPGNARGKEAEREEYEQRLAKAVTNAMRSTRPF